MKKQRIVATQAFSGDRFNEPAIRNTFDGCVSMLTGHFMTTDFTIEAVCVVPITYENGIQSFAVTMIGVRDVPGPDRAG